jgi:hypothetical protein
MATPASKGIRSETGRNKPLDIAPAQPHSMSKIVEAERSAVRFPKAESSCISEKRGGTMRKIRDENQWDDEMSHFDLSN